MVDTNPTKEDEGATKEEGGKEMAAGEVADERVEDVMIIIAAGVKIIIRIMILQVEV